LTMRAIVTDPSAPEFFTIKEVEAPKAQPWEAIVQVKAISLNRGEVKDAIDHGEMARPGWDFAGTVIEPAANGLGPKQGSRVVGLLPAGAWSEQVAAPVSMLAEIPDEVDFAKAATLPVAGLTALNALRKGGMLLGKRIFVTGSTGGVGLFAHQLAALSGAFAVGMASTEEKAKLVREAGADEVIVGYSRMEAAREFGPYDLIVDSVGGDTLAALLPLLAPQGICVYDEFGDERRKNFIQLLSRGGAYAPFGRGRFACAGPVGRKRPVNAADRGGGAVDRHRLRRQPLARAKLFRQGRAPNRLIRPGHGPFPVQSV